MSVCVAPGTLTALYSAAGMLQVSGFPVCGTRRTCAELLMKSKGHLSRLSPLTTPLFSICASMQLQTNSLKTTGKKRLSLPISPSKRDDRRSGDRRLATIFNKSCDLWLRLQKHAPTRLAVMVEMDGELEIFLSTYDALDGDWPPSREDIRVSHVFVSFTDLLLNARSLGATLRGRTTSRPSTTSRSTISWLPKTCGLPIT